MAGDNIEISALNEMDSAILNKKGWFMVTYYQSKNDTEGSRAYDLAISKAMSIKRQTGIRCVKKSEYTVYEVWEHW